jgi:hypothetical protein
MNTTKRLIADLLLLAAFLWFPWWIVLIVILVFSLLYRRFWEGLAAAFLFDLWYGAPTFLFHLGIWFSFPVTFAAAAIFFLLPIALRRFYFLERWRAA